MIENKSTPLQYGHPDFAETLGTPPGDGRLPAVQAIRGEQRAMKGRVVLITGAASGIGKALALLCATRQCQLVVVDQNAAAASEVAQEATTRGAPSAISIAADVRVEAEVERAFAEAEQRLGVPTAVCASAGIDRSSQFHDLPADQWRQVIAVNLDGVFHTAKHAIRGLLRTATAGSIVCVSSPAASVGFAAGGAVAYSASKGGVSALVRSLAVEYASRGIRVNAIVPGATETPLAWANVDPQKIPDFRKQLSAEIPLGRLAEPEEPARAALWLFSDESSYVTGSHLVCDGGILAKASISF
jgi:NAD(P)-dependent dehydrogenase (short-subunit alcohol dehydrogenase family)